VHNPGAAARFGQKRRLMLADPHAALEPQVTLPWLVRLRWLGAIGQVVALGVARWVFELELPWAPLLGLVGIAIGSNAVLALRAPHLLRRWPAAWILGAVLALDSVLLTALLSAAGGPMNPFTVFYLVHISLSAVVLSSAWTAAIAALSVLGFGLLFLLPAGAAHLEHHANAGLGVHLQGMWCAFVIAAGLTAFFVGRVAQAIARQREQIAILRESSARNARLAAVTTLAAGAAHELGNPLGTIAIAAHEACLALSALPQTPGLAETTRTQAAAALDDLRLIQLEVDRCQEILGQLSSRASPPLESEAPLPLSELAASVRAHLGEERARRVDIQVDPPGLQARVPRAQIAQSIVALVRNALDASGQLGRVEVAFTGGPADVCIAVKDHGAGIAADVLPRVGDPFFTTKQPGRGLGLGVFLARAFAESRGGTLLIHTELGAGTRALLRIPIATEHGTLGST
jgi:two-component system, sensor histidine kinase RegB